MTSAVLWSEWNAGWCARGCRSGDNLASTEEALSIALGRAWLNDDELALARTLDHLYASEINARVTCTGGAWTGEIGDDWNGFEDVSAALPVRVLLDWIPSAVSRAFPRSEYALSFSSR